MASRTWTTSSPPPFAAWTRRPSNTRSSPGLIFCLDRAFPFELNEIIAEKAIAWRDRGVVGIDIAGPESATFRVADYRRLFRRARQYGLGLTVHTGESGPADEVARVVEQLEPDRIGHGVKAAYDPRAMAMIRDRGIVLEICPTSNLNTRVVSGWDEFRWIFDTFRRNEVRFTINTDGPEMLKTYIRDEMAQLGRLGILSVDDQEAAAATSLAASFVPNVSTCRRRASNRRPAPSWSAKRPDRRCNEPGAIASPPRPGFDQDGPIRPLGWGVTCVSTDIGPDFARSRWVARSSPAWRSRRRQRGYHALTIQPAASRGATITLAPNVRVMSKVVATVEDHVHLRSIRGLRLGDGRDSAVDGGHLEGGPSSSSRPRADRSTPRPPVCSVATVVVRRDHGPERDRSRSLRRRLPWKSGAAVAGAPSMSSTKEYQSSRLREHRCHCR